MYTELLSKAITDFVNCIRFSGTYPDLQPAGVGIDAWTYCSDGSCYGNCVGGCEGTAAGG